MSNQIIHTDIPTARLFGKRGYGFNPIKGCDNKKCRLHPKNKGECWAAQICNRMAGPWASHEANYIEDNGGIRDNQEWGSKYYNYLNKLKYFHPAWLESQFQKQFPKERSCILVGYMTDIAFIPREWVQRIIDKIKANNEEREAAGLSLHFFQFLTKGPFIYAKFKWPINCWLGFTATNQSEFLSRYEEIVDQFSENYSTNQKYAYLEPLREEIKFPGYLYNATEAEWDKLWVIVGGGSTPLHPDWVRSIRDQCQAAGIPFFFKSWGEMIWFQNKQWMSKRDYQALLRIKEASGIMVGIPPDFNKKKYKENEIDDKVWEQFPEVE